MKTAIYIEDGVVQLVITPESDFEKNALKSFERTDVTADIFAGSFYDCRGGWTAQKTYYPDSPFNEENNVDRSLILRVEPKKVAESPKVDA